MFGKKLGEALPRRLVAGGNVVVKGGREGKGRINKFQDGTHT